MSDLVHARHPAPILHLPPRTRSPRIGVAELVTAVRLRALPRSAFAPLGALRRYEDRHAPEGGYAPVADRRDRHPSLSPSNLAQRLFAAEGGVWTILRTEPDAQGAWRPVHRREFSAFLSGDPIPAPVERGVVRALARTPAAIRGTSRKAVARSVPAAGEGKVLLDTRPEAPDALRRWLDRHVAIVGDEVRLRCLGPLMVPVGDWHADRVLETMAYGSDHPTAMAGLTGAGGAGNVHDRWASQMSGGLTPAALARLADRDDALAHFANTAPDAVCAVQAGYAQGFLGLSREAEEALRAFRVRAMVGGVGPHEAGRVADLVEAAVFRDRHWDPMRRDGPARLKRLLDHANAVVRPLLRAMPNLEDDAADLATLAP